MIFERVSVLKLKLKEGQSLGKKSHIFYLCLRTMPLLSVVF